MLVWCQWKVEEVATAKKTEAEEKARNSLLSWRKPSWLRGRTPLFIYADLANIQKFNGVHSTSVDADVDIVP